MFADVIKLSILRWGAFAGLGERALNAVTGIPTKEKQDHDCRHTKEERHHGDCKRHTADKPATATSSSWESQEMGCPSNFHRKPAMPNPWFGLRACRAVNECFPVVSVTLSGTTCCCKPRKLINVATIFSLSHPSSKYTFDFVLVASESLQQEGLGHPSRCDSHLHSPFPFQVFQFPP